MVYDENEIRFAKWRINREKVLLSVLSITQIQIHLRQNTLSGRSGFSQPSHWEFDPKFNYKYKRNSIQKSFMTLRNLALQKGHSCWWRPTSPPCFSPCFWKTLSLNPRNGKISCCGKSSASVQTPAHQSNPRSTEARTNPPSFLTRSHNPSS